MKHYDKANSILEIRDRLGDNDDLPSRFRALRDSVRQRPHDRRAAIVARACDDVLGEPVIDQRPRFILRPHVLAELRRLPDELIERYVFYRYRYDTYPLTYEVDDFPPCLQIEPTAICNYRCVFCYQTDTTLTSPKNGHMNIMSLDLFKQIVDEAEGRCEAVTLASRGEPLMARDIVAMLGYMAGKFAALKVNTNGWFLDEARSRALLEADVNTLVFSADAAEPDLYARLRVNGKLDRILRNIETFATLRAREYPHTRLITRVAGVRFTSEQEMSTMQSLWGGLVDQVAFVDYNPWENTYIRQDTHIAAPCSDLWRRMFVWADGRTNPCDVDYLSTLSPGRFQEGGVSKIWQSEAYNKLRTAHREGRRSDLTPCKQCTVV